MLLAARHVVRRQLDAGSARRRDRVALPTRTGPRPARRPGRPAVLAAAGRRRPRRSCRRPSAGTGAGQQGASGRSREQASHRLLLAGRPISRVAARRHRWAGRPGRDLVGPCRSALTGGSAAGAAAPRPTPAASRASARRRRRRRRRERVRVVRRGRAAEPAAPLLSVGDRRCGGASSDSYRDGRSPGVVIVGGRRRPPRRVLVGVDGLDRGPLGRRRRRSRARRRDDG